VADSPIRRSPRPTLFALVCLALLALAAGPALADAGMWTPDELQALAKQLKKDGLKLPAKKLADLDNGPLASVIHFNGCSASFVSADGLIVTNHHCAVGAIQFNSVKGPNLLEKGFTAKDRADERWAGPTSRVLVARKQTDVTKKFHAAIAKAKDDKAVFKAVDGLKKKLLADCEKRPNTRCRVAAYDGGARWLLIDQLELRDIRLVQAPPRAVGVYGGDTDNWMWPRHTGDWALFRAYVGKDGKAAEHAKTNVPYTPKKHLTVGKGVKPGDFVMVAGYPGSTNRYRTADVLKFVAQQHYPWLRQLLTTLLGDIVAVQKTSKEAKVKLTSIRAGLANYEKYLGGLLDGFAASKLVDRRASDDQQMAAWVAAKKDRTKKYAGALKELEKVQAKAHAHKRADQLLSWLFRLPTSLRTAAMLHWLSVERAKPDAERDEGYQKRDFERLKGRMEQRFKSYVPAGDRGMALLLLLEAARLPDGGRIAGLDAWLKRFADANDTSPALGGGVRKGQVERAVAWLFEKPTVLTAKATRAKLFGAKRADVEKVDDRLIQLSSALYADRRAAKDRSEAIQGAMSRLRPVYMAALRDWKGKALYSDANGTLRVTWGHVRGYSPREAVNYAPQTTLKGILQKDTGKEPFDCPKDLRKAAEALHAGKVKSRWADKKLGSVPVNYVSTVDTTGGNSGSATLDAEGKLVGLLFDGNYEAMASDWVFDTVKTRSIHVDARFMLWALESLYAGKHLVKEMLGK